MIIWTLQSIAATKILCTHQYIHLLFLLFAFEIDKDSEEKTLPSTPAARRRPVRLR
jgi:hypothetical protein